MKPGIIKKCVKILSFYFQINTGGCMTRLRAFVENNLYIVAGIALGVAVAQLLGIIYTHLLQLVIYLV